MKKISIIVPCYNAEKYIDRCLTSLVTQTIGIENIELILVNDASTDSTYQKLCDWENKFRDSILVINCEKNGKQGTARNIGISYASCDYIGFVDIDDWIEPSMYQKLYDKAISYQVDVVSCLHDMVSSKTQTYTSSANETTDLLFTDLNTPSNRKKFLNASFPQNIWSAIYKKEIITANHIFFPTNVTYEDNFWKSILNYYINSCYVLQEVLYHWYISLESTSRIPNSITHLYRLQVEKMLLEEYKKRGLYHEYEEQIDRAFLQRYYLNSLHTFFTRFDFFPIELFNGMQLAILKYIPDYKNISGIPVEQQALLDLINIDLTQNDLNEIQAQYKNEFKS